MLTLTLCLNSTIEYSQRDSQSPGFHGFMAFRTPVPSHPFTAVLRPTAGGCVITKPLDAKCPFWPRTSRGTLFTVPAGKFRVRFLFSLQLVT